MVGNTDNEGNPDPQYHSGWGEFYEFSTEDLCDKMPTNLYTTTNNNQNLITMNWDTPESGAPDHYFLELTNETTGQVFQWNNISGSATSKTKYNQIPGHSFSWEELEEPRGPTGTSWSYYIYIQPEILKGTWSRKNQSDRSIFGIYPNPTRGKFNLEPDLDNTQNMKIEITNVVGEIILSKTYNDFSGKFNESFDLTNSSNGIYFVKSFS